MKNLGEHMYQRNMERMRQEFEREKTAYQENASHLRSLNQFLWQVPAIAITLTGGLWFGVTRIDIILAKQWLLTFAAVSDFILVFVILRVRFLFGQYLAAQKGFCPNREIKSESGPWFFPTWTVVACFSILLLAATFGSVYGLVNVGELIAKSPAMNE